jgi:hypothetical protein
MAPMMATLLATPVAAIVAAARRGRVAAADVIAAAAAITTATKQAQQIEGLGLRRDTHQTRCQHGSHNTTLHGEAPQDLNTGRRKRKRPLCRPQPPAPRCSRHLRQP